MKTRCFSKILLPVVFVVGGLGQLSAQTVYRSVDGDGNVIYTDRPPLAQRAGDAPLDVMQVEIRLTDANTVAANREEATAQARAEAFAKDVRNEQESADAAQLARQEETRKANCDMAKARLTKYSTARRLFRDLGDGQREYLTDDEIDAERVKAARSVDEWCGR